MVEEQDVEGIFRMTALKEWEKLLANPSSPAYNPIAFRVVLIHMYAQPANSYIERWFSFLSRVKNKRNTNLNSSTAEVRAVLGKNFVFVLDIIKKKLAMHVELMAALVKK